MENVKQYLKFLSKQPRGSAFSSMSKKQKLGALKKEFAKCTRCPLAKQGRQNVVFGHGNPEAKLMFIGEGPGRDEDIQALPFVGRAGKLLTKIIEAMGLKRADIYISNVVKCRPPNNRAPLPNESQTCKSSILHKEIEIIQPKIICTLGATATQEILEKPISISKIRGAFIPIGDLLLMPTFHPAYLLRNPQKKTEVWQDMKKIIEKLAK
jgi:DNA polymerase